MAIRDVERDYETSWPLLETALREACMDPLRIKARKEVFKHLTPSQALAVSGDRQRKAAWRREIHRVGEALTALDAFAIWAKVSPRQNRTRFRPLNTIEGNLFRVHRWIEAWDRCQTDRHRGEQALITFALLRDDPTAAKSVAAHLTTKAEDADIKHELATAYRLRAGSLLCNDVPTWGEIIENAESLSQAERVELHRLRVQGDATQRAAAATSSYVVILNRLSDSEKAKKKNKRANAYKRRVFKTKEKLQQYVRKSLDIVLSGKKTDPTKEIICNVSMDVVGIIGEADGPVVCSLNRSHPHKITLRYEVVEEEEDQEEIEGENNNVRQWHDDLRAFLCRNLVRNPATVKDLVKLHIPNKKDPSRWLRNYGRGTENLQSLLREYRKLLEPDNYSTIEKLIIPLESILSRAKTLRTRATNNPYRTMNVWCRAVSRGVFDSEDRAKHFWVVRQPHKKKTSISTKLIFNDKHNYALIDFKSAAD